MNRSRLIVRVFCLAISILFLAFGTSYVLSANEQNYAVGIVYNDLNHNQVLDPGEKGIANIRVSNGRDIVVTDDQGKYRIPIEENMTIFVIKPSEWATAFDSNHVPKYYYIYEPKGSPAFKSPGVAPTGPLPKSIDFPLEPQKISNQFSALLFGDVQVRDQQDINYFAHDVVEEVAGTNALFGVTLGDNTFNNLSNYPRINQTMALIGIPFHYVVGNHDANFDSPNNNFAYETFRSVYGPPYYSFEYGQVHFIALDDIYWPENNPRPGYGFHAGLAENELQFIKNDLALVPKDKLVVLLMHIPINELKEKDEVFRLLETHPYDLSIAGHEHKISHHFLTQADGGHGATPHHLFITGAVCGNYWLGAPDELGIPNSMMADGSPNGYAIITFTGNKYSIEYKVARKPASYQMNLFAPDEITIDQATATEVIANIFAGSEKSTVEFKLGEHGKWLPMERTAMQDPYFLLLKKAEQEAYPPNWRKHTEPALSLHIWKAALPGSVEKGTQLIHVRTTDMFGHIYTANRVITIN